MIQAQPDPIDVEVSRNAEIVREHMVIRLGYKSRWRGNFSEKMANEVVVKLYEYLARQMSGQQPVNFEVKDE